MKPRSLVFNLYGDHVRHRGGEIGLRDLTALLGAFDVGEETARVTLSRMKREEWLSARRVGRASYYALNERSWRLLDEGRPRIFLRGQQEWDGHWRMVIYRVAESDRPARERLRRALSWLGFGPLAPSTWISPHDRLAHLEALRIDDDIQAQLDLFCVAAGDLTRDRELAARCWDLDRIDRAYRDFLARFATLATTDPPTLRDAFVARVRLVDDYRTFSFADPDLPTALLPSEWMGGPAYDLFLSANERLRTSAFAHYDAVVTPPE